MTKENNLSVLAGLGEWDNPYITLTRDFEATQIEIFSKMATSGYIYKGLKPVHWCPDCVTALAEAEIEYAEDPCYSIYVKFAVSDDKGILSKLGVDRTKHILSFGLPQHGHYQQTLQFVWVRNLIIPL